MSKTDNIANSLITSIGRNFGPPPAKRICLANGRNGKISHIPVSNGITHGATTNGCQLSNGSPNGDLLVAEKPEVIHHGQQSSLLTNGHTNGTTNGSVLANGSTNGSTTMTNGNSPSDMHGSLEIPESELIYHYTTVPGPHCNGNCKKLGKLQSIWFWFVTLLTFCHRCFFFQTSTAVRKCQWITLLMTRVHRYELGSHSFRQCFICSTIHITTGSWAPVSAS